MLRFINLSIPTGTTNTTSAQLSVYSKKHKQYCFEGGEHGEEFTFRRGEARPLIQSAAKSDGTQFTCRLNGVTVAVDSTREAQTRQLPLAVIVRISLDQ